MYKVVSIEPTTKVENVHWYATQEEAEDAAYALYMHPLFKKKTKVYACPNAYIGYESR